MTATERRLARIARGKADPSLIPHGTLSGYSNWACLCDACRAAGHAEWAKNGPRYNRNRKAKRDAR